MLILIDNFDSFTYNIVHAFLSMNLEIRVFRNDAISVEQLFALKPHYLVVGPGPGNPASAGISKKCIKHASEFHIPVLGICLGHQAIGEVFGGKVRRAQKPMHGKMSAIFHSGSSIFQGLPQGFQATRYHSLVIDPIPELDVLAWTEEKEVMGLSHPQKPIYGVQFHPESIATIEGLTILRNFIHSRKF